MKTRLALLVQDTNVDESERGELIEIGRSFATIRHEMEQRFANDTDEDFRSGKLGFFAKSRKEHITRIALDDLHRQLDYTLAGRIMSVIGQEPEAGREVTFKFVEYTEAAWKKMEEHWEHE